MPSIKQEIDIGAAPENCFVANYTSPAHAPLLKSLHALPKCGTAIDARISYNAYRLLAFVHPTFPYKAASAASHRV